MTADTGYWVALGNRNDRFHLRAKTVLAGLKDTPITTWSVITETSYLLQRLGGTPPSLHFWVHREKVRHEYSTRLIHGGGCRLRERFENDHFSRMYRITRG